MIKKHYLYNPGDLLIEYWDVKGRKVNIARYIVYDKNEVKHCTMKDVGYTSYKCYVMYTHDPWNREDRSGLNMVGETYEITCWNDMDCVSPNYPIDGIDVVRSGLLWDDRE